MDIEKFNEFTETFDESATVRMSGGGTYSNPIDPQDTRACGLPFERLYIWYDGTKTMRHGLQVLLSPGNVSEISIAKHGLTAKLRQLWNLVTDNQILLATVATLPNS